VPVDLNVLVLDLDSMLRRLIGANIELVTVLAQETLTVSADPGQMEQVITNLVVNARDAMPDGGKLKVETATAGHDHAVLKVTDSGLGMTDEVRQRIFEPFYTTKEVGEGSGLGLSTSYGIVAQSGGRIDVDSRPGQGSTFSVALPITEDRPVVSPPQEPEVQNGGKETTLLVENEPTVRSMTSEALRELGYRVLVAKNGVDALSVEETHRGDKIDLLLTDLVMPMLGGGETAHRIGQRRAGIKVLFTSGFHSDALEDLGAGSSQGQFLPKPFTLDSLAAKVRAETAEWEWSCVGLRMGADETPPPVDRIPGRRAARTSTRHIDLRARLLHAGGSVVCAASAGKVPAGSSRRVGAASDSWRMARHHVDER
jgi:two-component system cell cycle sensor histidine kinase/response regulator CckA